MTRITIDRLDASDDPITLQFTSDALSDENETVYELRRVATSTVSSNFAKLSCLTSCTASSGANFDPAGTFSRASRNLRPWLAMLSEPSRFVLPPLAARRRWFGGLPSDRP